MRTVEQIKETIVVDFMNNETVADMFGFPAGDNFAAHFSKVSIINILFYLFASAAWVLEQLFESHKKEVEERIDRIIPHRPKWYRDKALGFMKDMMLIPDTDDYDTSDMSDSDIEAAKVVRHAVAVESSDASLLTIKVAGETGGKRCPLDDETERQLTAYLAEIKDAGVYINLVNEEPETFDCNVDIYYNAILSESDVRKRCEEAIDGYIKNLPFNGEYSDMALTDALQAVEGVKIVHFGGSKVHGIEVSKGVHIPEAGYLKTGAISVNMIAHD
ncbi:MAG: hypothetical protein K2L01_06950 [Rikenellaceae bacterium]|nr:hypothetical protein [Rikenellaceae bacterium]